MFMLEQRAFGVLSIGLILLLGLVTPNFSFADEHNSKNKKVESPLQTSNEPTDSLPQTTNLQTNDLKKYSKLSTKLAGLFEKYQKGESVSQYVTDTLLHEEDGMIRAVISLDDDSDENLDELESYGIEIETKHQKLLQVKLPYSQLENIANMIFVNYIREPFLEIPDIVSEGPSVINSDLVNNGGNTGQGIRVAVIDVGFDVTNPEISGNIVEAISFRGDSNILGDDIGDTNHGTTTAELVVDVAPDVDLYLYNVQTSLERIAVLDFIINNRPNIDIITASLASFSGPHDGTSDISLKMNEAKNAGFVVVNSAGNYADGHWNGQFLDLDTDGFHEFSGIDETIQITAFAGAPIILDLTWDETWGSAAQDYELQLYDATITLVAQSINFQSGTQDPHEFIGILAPSTGIYHVVIQKFSATQSVNFDLFSINHSFDEYNVPSSSIPPSADAVGAISVGATFWFDDQLEFFSSRGPTNDGRIKPDLSAPDGVTTSIFNSFFGTSASAPYVAGAAALTKFANPGSTPSTIQSLLEQNTFSNHPKNNNDGTGRLDVSFLIAVALNTILTDKETYNLGEIIHVTGETIPDTTRVQITHLNGANIQSAPASTPGASFQHDIDTLQLRGNNLINASTNYIINAIDIDNNILISKTVFINIPIISVNNPPDDPNSTVEGNNVALKIGVNGIVQNKINGINLITVTFTDPFGFVVYQHDLQVDSQGNFNAEFDNPLFVGDMRDSGLYHAKFVYDKVVLEYDWNYLTSVFVPPEPTSQAIGQTTILGTCGLSFPDGNTVDYGALLPNTISNEVALNMTNSGSVTALLEVRGTDWQDVQNNSVMNVNRTHYNTTSAQPFASNTSLETFDQITNSTFVPGITLETFWQLETILLDQSFTGTASQTMDFTVSC